VEAEERQKCGLTELEGMKPPADIYAEDEGEPKSGER
jgi:hypothetical protein